MFFSIPSELPVSKPNYDWSDVYFAAASEFEEHTNAKIVSAKAEYKNAIHDRAFAEVLSKYPDWGYKETKRAENFLRKRERELAERCDEMVFESVERLIDGSLKIVVNVDERDSETSINRALDLVSIYLERVDEGIDEKLVVGRPIKFTPDQIRQEYADID